MGSVPEIKMDWLIDDWLIDWLIEWLTVYDVAYVSKVSK